MFNPFAPFSKPLLDSFVRSGKRYFVRQAYGRAFDHVDERIKGAFIFTHYSEIGHAQHHYGAISHDPTKFMYEWRNPVEQKRLITAATNPPGYKIYSSVFDRDWRNRITNPLKEKARRYIEMKIKWKPASGETVAFEIYVHYGELYAKLKLRSQEVRVKLEDIENFR